MAKRHQVSKKGDADLQRRLGAVVRTCRQQLGITQEELAWRADMHRTYIADIERGARNVTLRSVVNLAAALEVAIGDLFSYADSSVAPARGGTGAGAAQSGSGEILLVEDSSADAALTVRAFKHACMTNPIRIARSGEDALDFLFGVGRHAKRKRVTPQLILLDINLPEMSGLEFLRRVKADERTRDIPVVVLTVSRNDRTIMECAHLGAENYIVKPVRVENLVQVTPKLNLHLTLGSSPELRKVPGSA